MKKGTLIFILLLCAVFFGSNYGMAAVPDGNVIYNTSKGFVNFDHVKHMKLVIQACVVCHEKDPIQKPVVDRKYAHSICKGCHKTSINDYPNAPVSCIGCHKP